MKKGCIDLVVCGPDMSGTSTQIKDIAEHYQSVGLKVRDMRGTEIDALFHSELFKNLNGDFASLDEYFDSDKENKHHFSVPAMMLLKGLKVASMVRNEITAYVDPEVADVWVFEEPTKRSAGQVNRVIEQNRSAFGSEMDAHSAALTHQVYRIDEFLRFRKPLREQGKTIIRSRSEESACYQVYDPKILPNGLDGSTYIELPGQDIALSNPPTHLFVVCAPENWTKKDYFALKEEGSMGRVLVDHE